MSMLNVIEYDRLGPDGLAPLEPALRWQTPLTMGSSAVRSQQLDPRTRWVRLVCDVRCRIKLGDSTVAADVTSQPLAADVAQDFPVSGAVPAYVSGIAALDPTAPNNTVAPAITGTQTVGQVLTCSTGTWVGAATITFAYQWYRDGAAISGQTAATHTLVTADVGTTLTCVVTASNSMGAVPATSNAIQMAPTNSVAPAITGTAQVGQTLSCSQGTWTGTSLVYSYQWKRGGSNIAGATSSTYVVVVADVGATLTCAVTADHLGSQFTVTSAATAAVTDTPAIPVNTVRPSVSGTKAEGQTLTCSQGTWTGTPTPSYTYQWRLDGVDIAGATANTRIVDAGDLAGALNCRVTATNSAGSASVISTQGSAAAPVNTGLPVIIGPYFRVGEVISCSSGTWSSGGTPTFTYQWKRGGSNIGGATFAAYTLVGADAGASVTCQVTATNSSGSTSATSAPASTIAA
jgi:hypothetical protein